MADFDWPPAACDGEEIGQGRGAAFGGMAQVERVLVLFPVREAADQQELLRVGRGEQRPVRVAGAFRPVPAGPLFEHRLANRPVSACDLVLRDGDHGVAGNDGDVGQAERPQPGPEVAGPAVHFVGGGPQHPQPARDQALHLLKGQLRLGRERQALRDPGFLPALRVPGPAVRHVHVEIDPRLPARGDQRGEHPGHAVLDPAGHPGVLRRHARGRLPLAQVSGLVEREPGADLVVRVIAQYLPRELRQCRPDRFPSPFPPAEQGLDQVRPLVPGLPRQLPRVRPGLPRQPADVVHCGRQGAPLLHRPGQQPSDQRICPLPAFCGILYAGHRGRGLVVLYFHKIKGTSHGRLACHNPQPVSRP